LEKIVLGGVQKVDLKISVPLGQDNFGPVNGIDVKRQTIQIAKKEHGLPEGYTARQKKLLWVRNSSSPHLWLQRQGISTGY